MTMNINDIRAVDWKYLVNRKEAVLFGSITDNCHTNFKKCTGLDWNMQHILRLGNGDVLMNKKDLQEIHAIFSEGKEPYLQKFRDDLIQYISELEAVGKKIKGKKWAIATQEELQKAVDEYLEASLHAQVFLIPVVVADKVLQGMIKEKLPNTTEEERQTWLRILTFPTKENEHAKEQKSFYNLCKKHKEGHDNLNEVIEEHLKVFAWLGSGTYWLENAWKKEDIQKRINTFHEQQKDAEKEEENLEKNRKESKEERKILYEKLQIDSHFDAIVQLAQEYAYLRTWRSGVMYQTGHRVKNLLYETAQRAGVEAKDVIFFNYKELQQMAKSRTSPISKEDIQKRKQYCTKIHIKGEYQTFAGEEWKEIFAQFIPKQDNTENVSGMIAQKGNVQGAVKIVHTTKDLHKVQQGDILISVMTFPHFIAAMEVAAAFVTDEGGILCHAAIVSREMQKPCVIGTKIATKVFKDGDMVEVDANNGTVKKIS
jgi:phosphohistidine swiveling domain-containing protein